MGSRLTDDPGAVGRPSTRPARDHARNEPAVPTDRRFYAGGRAIGRFGMRIFEPQLMPVPHWHGHVECNLITGGSMTYVIEDQEIEIPAGRLVVFWAGIPHQLVRLTPTGDGPMRLANIYLPLDAVLLMPHIAPLQAALLSGGLVALDPQAMPEERLMAWMRDYRSGRAARREVMVMEINAMLRRALLDDLEFLRPPMTDGLAGRGPQWVRMAHVVTMVGHIMENLDQPMSNADVARVAGLHENYALSLFSGALRMPMRRFIIRMRLLRARALLMESGATVATVAMQAGFASVSQFYGHFRRAYGITPQAMREGRARDGAAER